MNKITKKTAFGIVGASAATLLVGGFAAPAMAGTSDSHTPVDSITETSSESTQTHLDFLDEVGVQNGDILGGDLLGDISNESPVVVAPEVGDIGSGNAIGSGNETAIGNNVGNGNEVGANVSDIVDSTTGVSSEVSDVVENVTDVSDVVDSATDVSDIVDSVDVDGMIGDITDDLDLGGILSE